MIKQREANIILHSLDTSQLHNQGGRLHTCSSAARRTVRGLLSIGLGLLQSAQQTPTPFLVCTSSPVQCNSERVHLSCFSISPEEVGSSKGELLRVEFYHILRLRFSATGLLEAAPEYYQRPLSSLVRLDLTPPRLTADYAHRLLAAREPERSR